MICDPLETLSEKMIKITCVLCDLNLPLFISCAHTGTQWLKSAGVSVHYTSKCMYGHCVYKGNETNKDAKTSRCP